MDNTHNLNENLIEKSNKKDDQNNQHLSLTQAIINVINNAVPATFGILFVFILETINIIFIGRYNDPDLISGIGFGTLYVNITGYIIGFGLLGGLDTLCSQAYGGKRYELLGIYANICRMVIVVFFIIICLPAIYFTSTLMNLIGQFNTVTVYAARFSHSMIPALFFSLQYQSSLRYLQSMNIFRPGMWITLFTALLHPVWCYIFIFQLNLDVLGAGIAIGISQLLNWIIVVIYINMTNPCPESYFLYHADVFKWEYILNYLKKAVPSAVLFAADWIGFEIVTFISSYLTESDFAANICLFNFITIIFMIPNGLSLASTALVGNAIGENNPEKAKTNAKAAVIVDVAIIGTITIFVIIFTDSIPLMYTADTEVITKVSGLLGIYKYFSVIDSIQVVLNGVIKGVGKQKIAAIICIVVLYPINISLAYSLAFVYQFGLYGLWYAQMTSIYILAFSFISIVTCLDWEMVAHTTAASLRKNSNKLTKKEIKNK